MKKEPPRRKEYNDYGDYQATDYDDYNTGYKGDMNTKDRGENMFSKEDIARMKQKFEEKLKKDFPKRRDGQKTTLELIPELNTFVEPFFPKRPPPGAAPPPGAGPPPGPATHPPTPSDENWNVPATGWFCFSVF